MSRRANARSTEGTAALQLVSCGRACLAERPGQPRSTFRLLIGAVAASRPKMSYGKTCWLPAAVLFRALGERSRIIIFARSARPTSPPVRPKIRISVSLSCYIRKQIMESSTRGLRGPSGPAGDADFEREARFS